VEDRETEEIGETVNDTQAPETNTALRDRCKTLGVTRAALAELTGLTPAKCWRIEQGRPRDDELTLVIQALDTVERDGLPEHLRRKTPKAKAARVSNETIERVRDLLDKARDAKTLKDVRALVEEARLALAETPTTDEKTAG
jgi:transcriptional regulator with XRE-family HTH domain